MTVEIIEDGSTVLVSETSTLVDGGIRGPQGAAGIGLPTGGVAGQIVKKNSSTNYDVGWGPANDYGVPLVDGANIAVNAALGGVFSVTLGGNRTMDNPTNPTARQKIIFAITQDGTGSRTITWGSKYRFSVNIPSATLSTTASVTDYIGFIYNDVADKWDCLAISKGYA